VSNVRARAVLAAYRTAAAVVPRLPRPVARGLGSAAGLAMMAVDAERRRLVARHQRRAQGPLLPAAERRAVRHAFTSYARYWVEMFDLPTASKDELEAGVVPEGLHHLETVLAAGKGAVMAIPHLGGWEWAGAWFPTARGHPVSVVVEPVSPPALFDWFVEVRSGMGMSVIPLGSQAASSVLAALGRNEVVCLLCDRDIGGTGIEVEFFGERTTLPAGPATLALRSGAAILPTAVYFTGERHLVFVRPPIDLERTSSLRADVARVTQAMAGELEQLIRRAPEQWHLMQPNWPSDHR
jgi:phosphatidylinositol dimannoside acyltransferase